MQVLTPHLSRKMSNLAHCALPESWTKRCTSGQSMLLKGFRAEEEKEGNELYGTYHHGVEYNVAIDQNEYYE